LLVFAIPCLLAVIAKRRSILWGLIPFVIILVVLHLNLLSIALSDQRRLLPLALGICIISTCTGLVIRWLISDKKTLRMPDSMLSGDIALARRGFVVRIVTLVFLMTILLAAMARSISEYATDELIGSTDVGFSDVSSLKFLLAIGADAKARDTDGRTTLMCVVDHSYWGDYACLKYLVSKGVDVNVKDRYGRTALMDAAWHDHPDYVKLLISKGADVNVKDNDGMTALMYAPDDDSAESAKLLISAHADMNAKNSSGKTALDLAKDHSIAVENILEAAGAKK
jgi:hypothetical protein